VYEVPSSGLIFRKMVDNPYISQILRMTIPNIYSMFRNFTAIAIMFLQFIPFSSFYALFPSKSYRTLRRY
jgi:hypothetical protein